jgi:hypothetical protein
MQPNITAECVALYLHSREVPSSVLGPDTVHNIFIEVFLNPFRKVPECALNSATIASFRIFSN